MLEWFWNNVVVEAAPQLVLFSTQYQSQCSRQCSVNQVNPGNCGGTIPQKEGNMNPWNQPSARSQVVGEAEKTQPPKPE